MCLLFWETDLSSLVPFSPLRATESRPPQPFGKGKVTVQFRGRGGGLLFCFKALPPSVLFGYSYGAGWY